MRLVKRYGSTHIVEPVAGGEDDNVSHVHRGNELGVKLIKLDVIRVYTADLLSYALQTQSSRTRKTGTKMTPRNLGFKKRPKPK